MLRRLQRPSRAQPPHVRVNVAALGLALVLLGCTARGGTPSPTGRPDTPEQAAAALAAGIARLDVSQVSFVGAAAPDVNKQFTALVTGMGSGKPGVTVGPVDAQGSKASATLQYAWTFPGVPQRWSYTSAARLVKEGGGWKTSWQPSLVEPGLDGTNRLSERRDQAPRGEILGANGDSIVKLRPVVHIGIDKTTITGRRAADSATRLARLVHVNAKAYAAKVAAAGPRDFVEAIVLRATSNGRPSNASVSAIPGAASISGDEMLAPNRDFARAILGTVGPASKEIVDGSQGAVSAGDEVGRSGLQRRYDGQLRGTPGATVRLLAAKPVPSPGASPSPSPPVPSPSPSPAPTPAKIVFLSKPVAGKDLRTTLSLPLQSLAEKILATVKPAAAIVAIRPSTGEVLAAANGPGSGDQSVATLGRYPPGSTFKVVSSLALLRAGLKPTSRVPCPATVTVDGKKFKNYSDYPGSHLGTIDLKTALAQSCNTAFIGQRGKLSGMELADAAGSLGLGIDYDVGFASFFGSVPPDKTATGRAAAMIGQGQVLASPLVMASVAASVSAGSTVVPSMIVGTKAGSKAKPLTKAEAGSLRQMMAAVVSEGSGRVLRRVGGPTIIAKTGTAEYGSAAPFKTHAWMIAAQGDLAVAVFVGSGSTGSHTAGPLLAQFLSGAR
jgi:cell division protein FtsI/penicillin-binding protein 2